MVIDRVAASMKAESALGSEPAPVDLVTASGSGIDPDITLAAALFQVPRIARERHMAEGAVEILVRRHITPRQLGLLGEPRLNVLSPNLDLAR